MAPAPMLALSIPLAGPRRGEGHIAGTLTDYRPFESVAVERKAAEQRSVAGRAKKKEPLPIGFFLLMLILGALIGAAVSRILNH